MQRDLHLDTAQATALLAREQAAGRTERDLRGALGARCAGAWLTEGPGKLVVAITDPAQAGRVRAAGAEPRIVKHSEGKLTAVKSTLDKAARSQASSVSGATKWAVTGLAENTRRMVTRDGVGVTLVNPGATETNFFDADGGPPDRAMLTAGHIADAIAWAIGQPAGVDVNTLTIRPVSSPL